MTKVNEPIHSESAVQEAPDASTDAHAEDIARDLRHFLSVGPKGQAYYGTKCVNAWREERDGKPGYAVKYADGYISWSPADVFEAVYQPVTGMEFGHALKALKEGHRVARAGWNSKGMFVFLVAGSVFKVNREPLMSILGEGTEVQYQGHIDMRTADGTIVPWLASQTDLLADDWQIVPMQPDPKTDPDIFPAADDNVDVEEVPAPEQVEA